jgi:signal transduction histidine kinase
MLDEDAYLKGLSEEDLRAVVLIPLLIHMGLRDVIEYHGGSAEKGKDIIAHYSGPLGDRHYVAVVAKATDIHGSVSKRGSASEVLMQAEQALNEPYTDIYDLKEVRIDECWIITSGEIKNTAVESIRGKLAKSNLDKLVRFVDRPRLIQLISLHIPTFWHHERILLQFAHEMRGSLVGIHAAADFLRRELSTERRNQVVDGIEVQILRAIDTLQSWSLAQGQSREPILDWVDVSSMVRKAVSTLAHEGRGIELQIEEGLPKLFGDERLLIHALRCVLDNAVRYSYSNSTVMVRVAAGTGGKDLLIEVSDQGIGVPSKEQSRIFEPGFQASNARMVRATGLGMGLAVARRILSQHKGELKLTRGEKPTEFVLQLPLGAQP